MGTPMMQALWFIPGQRIFLLVLRLFVLRKSVEVMYNTNHMTSWR
jgi:hypothetical protein